MRDSPERSVDQLEVACYVLAMGKRLLGGVVPVLFVLACAESRPEPAGSEGGATTNTVTSGQPSSASTLRASGDSGLLGAPLPEGAVLVGSNESGGSQGPSQQYEVNASAEEIGAFFQEFMAEEGWEPDGSSSADRFFFARGNLILGVLIPSEGGEFTLLGY